MHPNIYIIFTKERMVVELQGVEPWSKQAAIRLSTRLFCHWLSENRQGTNTQPEP